MNSKRRIRTLIAALAAVLVVSASVSAYVLLSPRRIWRSKPNYIVDNRGLASIADSDHGITRTVNAIVSSVAWNGSGAAIGSVINAQAGSVSGWRLGDGIPMLNFQDPENACLGNCLAATFTSYYTGNRITDADIVTNSTGHLWTSQGEDPNGAGCSNEFYIEGVQVHETGHGLGLGHTGVSGATMFPSVAACSNAPATTENDDEAGIRDLYSCTAWYGTLCDPLYVPPVTCCASSCYSPYPGVPKYCL